MRWKTRVPIEGTRRTIKRFAFIPKHLDDGYTVFFEVYLVDQILNRVSRGKNKYKWKTVKTKVK